MARVKFKEETHSSLIQTGASSSLNLRSQMLGARRAKTVEKGYPFEWISEARAARVLENYCHLSGHPPGHPVGILGHPASFFGHPGFRGLPGPSATIVKRSKTAHDASDRITLL